MTPIALARSPRLASSPAPTPNETAPRKIGREIRDLRRNRARGSGARASPSDLTRTGRGTLAGEDRGWAAITADVVLLCTHAYSAGLTGGLAPRSFQLPADCYRAAAESGAAFILPGGEVPSDTRRIIRYWRLDGVGR